MHKYITIKNQKYLVIYADSEFTEDQMIILHKFAEYVGVIKSWILRPEVNEDEFCKLMGFKIIKKSQPILTINLLPIDMIHEIIKNFDIETFVNFTSTCRDFKKFESNNRWKEYLELDYSGLYNDSELYKHQYSKLYGSYIPLKCTPYLRKGSIVRIKNKSSHLTKLCYVHHIKYIKNSGTHNLKLVPINILCDSVISKNNQRRKMIMLRKTRHGKYWVCRSPKIDVMYDIKLLKYSDVRLSRGDIVYISAAGAAEYTSAIVSNVEFDNGKLMQVELLTDTGDLILKRFLDRMMSDSKIYILLKNEIKIFS